jgi:dTMP kinase
MDDLRDRVLPRFIVLEGVDGAGTTTQLRNIEKALARGGLPHWTSSEPTEGPVGRLIRRVLAGEIGARPGTLAHLFAADRYEHLYGPGGIVERTGRGEIVVCDRYVFSSMAYQGIACGPELPLALNAPFPLPELLLFFDVEPTISMDRIGSRGSREIYESLPFQEKVRKAYEETLAGFAATPMRLVRVDARLPPDEVERAVLDGLGELLGVPL